MGDTWFCKVTVTGPDRAKYLKLLEKKRWRIKGERAAAIRHYVLPFRYARLLAEPVWEPDPDQRGMNRRAGEGRLPDAIHAGIHLFNTTIAVTDEVISHWGNFRHSVTQAFASTTALESPPLHKWLSCDIVPRIGDAYFRDLDITAEIVEWSYSTDTETSRASAWYRFERGTLTGFEHETTLRLGRLHAPEVMEEISRLDDGSDGSWHTYPERGDDGRDPKWLEECAREDAEAEETAAQYRVPSQSKSSAAAASEKCPHDRYTAEGEKCPLCEAQFRHYLDGLRRNVQ